MLALAALPLFVSVGAAVDYSRAGSGRTAMQSALDAAALMMAKDARNVEVSQLNANAKTYFAANFVNSEVKNVNIEATASSTSNGYSVSLSATGSVSSRFMGVVGFQNITVAARTSAMSNADGLGCVLSLDPYARGAALGQGSTTVALNGCSLYDNSNDTAALTVGGSAQISALSVGVVGNVSGASNVTTTFGIQTGMGAIRDPYADASFPAFSSCSQQNFGAHDTRSINPGVYCGGMNINAGANITLNPGIYYIDGGDLSVNGGATLTGSGVTLVFTSQNRNGYATASINGNATIDLRPPTTGPTAGIVVFGDRGAPIGTSFKFNGGVMQYFGGAIYVPKGAVSFSGGAGTSKNCTQLIGNTITFTGNSALALNCQGYGTRPFSALVVRLNS
jgi:Flp pilus assembly protein TadG